jgi:hypothetical protein
MDRSSETETIQSAVNAALELAAGGAPQLGYRILDLTLARWERRAAPAPPDELDRLRMALVLFARAHGIWFQMPPEADELVPPRQVEHSLGETRKLVHNVQECRERAAATRQRTREAAARSRERREEWQGSEVRRRVVLLVGGAAVR